MTPPSICIFAAGYGTRLRPLTNHTPKPLIQVGEETLITRLLRQLSAVGIQHVYINVCHLKNQIIDTLGQGQAWGMDITYIDEGDTPLETAGTIRFSLEQGIITSRPLITINADLYTDYPFANLFDVKPDWAHLVMVPNPPHHPQGDFSCANGIIGSDSPRYTYSGIGVYNPALIRAYPAEKKLGPILRQALSTQTITAEVFNGIWHDIGSPERLSALRASLNHS